MHFLAQLSWRQYPSAILIGLGLLLAIQGARRCHMAWRHPATDLMRPLPWVRGVRGTIFGLALAGIGAAWWWHLAWLLALALVIGFEETLETSIAIAALAVEEPSPRERPRTA